MVTLRTLRFVRAAFALWMFIAVGANAAIFNRKWEDDRLTLIPDTSRAEGEWHAGVEALKGNRNSGIPIEIREGNSTYGFYLPTERAPRIEGKIKDGNPIHFTIGAESGDFQFEGAAKGKSAGGHYKFEPNKEYATEAGKLLNIELTTDELVKLAFARISLSYIRAVHETLPSASLEEVVR